MIKDVIIDIQSFQSLDDQKDTIEFTTDGKFGFKNGEYYISYDEGKLFESEREVRTKIFLKPDNSATLLRSGAFESRMLIEKGKRNTCFYSTPYGEMVIGIYGEQIENNLSDCGGYLKLKYNIDSNLQLLSRNEVKISIREVK